MKSWIETNIIGTGAEDDPRRPDLGGYEDDPEVVSSTADRGDGTCLCRVAGPRAKVQAIVAAKGEQTDDQADSTIKGINPNAGLENVDVPDVELNTFLEAEGIDPLEVRRRAQTPIVGRQVLQAQERECLREIGRKLGIDFSDLEGNILKGHNGSHESAMARIRRKEGATK